jgi:diguanylate cyclase (GGDEF)-like protein
VNNWLNRLLKTEGTANLFVLATVAVAVFIVRLTGGSASPYLPLLFLPVIFAIIRCRLRFVIALGLILGGVSLLMEIPFLGGRGLATEEVVRALTLIVIALVGGLYANQVNRERISLQLSVAEKDELLNISQIINSSDKLDYALDSILLTLHKMYPGLQSAAIFLTGEAQHSMQMMAVLGATPGDLKFERFSLRARHAGWSPNDSTPLYIPDVEAHRHVRLLNLDPRARAVACVSLRSLKVPFGMLYLSFKIEQPLDEAQLRLLRQFADRIGFPLYKLRLQEGLEDLAFTDEMTRLYNFRFFRKSLEDELKRSARYHHPLAVILLDLDDFKTVNDRYGHEAGNRVLIQIAELLRRSIREADLAARYGGEEFVIVCPETHASEAEVVAERVRSAVAETRFDLGNGLSCAMTVSAGVSAYPGDAPDENALIQTADSALYEAKRAGKNRIILASSLISPAMPDGG